MTDNGRQNRHYELMSQPTLSDADINEMCSLWSHPTNQMVRQHVLGLAQLRMDLELITSISRFDKASGNLIETTNRLTKWMLKVTILAAILVLANVVASAWLPLTWFVSHGFRFH
jgi:Mg2+ and Co2+ transporter CorA